MLDRQPLAGPGCTLPNFASSPVGDASFPRFTGRRGTGCVPAAPFCLPPQMGAGDQPGQDAQPRLHPLPLRVGVLRGRSLRGPPAGGPGFPVVRFPVAPGGTSLSVCSCLVSHSLSLTVCDWTSVSSWCTGFRIMSFTFQRLGASAPAPTPSASVNNPAPSHNLPGAPAFVRGRAGPYANGPSCDVIGVYREMTPVAEMQLGLFRS